MALFVIMLADHYIYPLDTRVEPVTQFQPVEQAAGYIPLSET